MIKWLFGRRFNQFDMLTSAGLAVLFSQGHWLWAVCLTLPWVVFSVIGEMYLERKESGK